MPNFYHSFYPKNQNTLGATADLTVSEIETVGLLEVLQTPGVSFGSWSIFDALLDSGNSDFVFLEPLGQAREVKTAISGLFGRFVARAYATKFLGYTHYDHIQGKLTSLNHTTGGQVKRVKGAKGDMPDWATWGPSAGLGIVEAKGCHDKTGPAQALNRAYQQAKRAEIAVHGRRAPFKRYAIATRWGFTSISTLPFLAVKDPPVPGDNITPSELQSLYVGLVRRHCANLLRSLGYKELAQELFNLTRALSSKEETQSLKRARQLLQASTVRDLAKNGTTDAYSELIGNVVLRGGILAADLSEADKDTLIKLDMRPTFVGIELHALKKAIEGEVSLEHSPASKNKPRRYPIENAGGRVVRLYEGKIATKL